MKEKLLRLLDKTAALAVALVGAGAFLVGMAQDTSHSIWIGRAGLALILIALAAVSARSEKERGLRDDWNARLAERRGDDAE